jgi:hypothetical protein
MTDDERKRYDDDIEFRNAACEHGSQRRKCNICELFCEQHDNAALRARIEVLEKVAEAAHKHRVTVMLSIHDASDVLSRKEMDDICRTDEALKAALDAAKEGK